MLEIRWHGRGGQGVKTASYLLAESFMELGKFIQAFPEYGPERSGAPVTAYTRVSDEQICIHSPIVNPDVVIVVDASLIPFVNVVKGLKENGMIIVNTKKTPDETLKELSKYDVPSEVRIATVDATAIALDTIKRPIPNVPLIGAFVKVTGLLKIDDVVQQLRHSFSKKFRDEIVNANVLAVKRGYEEVNLKEFTGLKAKA